MRARLLACVVLLLPVTAMTLTPEEDAVYRERIRLINGGRAADPTGTALYQPLEPVPGDQRWQPLPAREPAARRVSAEAWAAARDYAARSNSNALVVWHDGAVEYAEYFGRHRAELPVVARSLAKPVTTVAVGRALALGRIQSLDQPAATRFDEWQAWPKNAILVRHLLDMRGGFLAQGPTFDPASIFARAYASPRHDEVMLREYPLTHTPGTRYEYANTPSDLVAPLIERATGQRYAGFLSREVFKPIGAPDGQVWINRPGGVAHAGCCLLAPAELWLRLAILLMDDGVWNGQRLLPEGYVQAVRTPTPQNPWAGMGVYVAGDYVERRGAGNPDLPPPIPKTLHSEPYLARDLFLFDGNANQAVWIVPSLRLIVLRTGDDPPRGPGLPEWDNAFLPNTIIRGLPEEWRRRAEPQPRPQVR
jgi:CubicO group peptidase (beta-lactamase class C family)